MGNRPDMESRVFPAKKEIDMRMIIKVTRFDSFDSLRPTPFDIDACLTLIRVKIKHIILIVSRSNIYRFLIRTHFSPIPKVGLKLKNDNEIDQKNQSNHDRTHNYG